MSKMSKDAELACLALQLAVDQEMERMAKFGYKAVVADKHGRPKLVSARYLVRKRRAELAAEAAKAAEAGKNKSRKKGATSSKGS